jgi:transposase
MTEGAVRIEGSGEAPMLSQDQWGAIRTLHERGVGKKAIARELGISVPTVRRYLRQGGREPYRRRSPVTEALERDHGEWLSRRAPEVNWVAQVLFQELRDRGWSGCYEVVKRWVRPLRQEQQRLEAATVRFETGPGHQAQVDWGSKALWIGDELQRAHLFVMTLGFSRRIFARAYPHERLAALLDGHERAFLHFGGRTAEMLYDNPRTIVLKRDVDGRHVEWHPIFRDFADRYGFTTRLCRPYRARTKGKVESGVKYIKHNALAGRRFTSWETLNDWLEQWALTIADERIHGTTHERPVERFRREALVPVTSVPPYRLERHSSRIVATDCLVSLDTNRYSVPWQLVGETVAVSVEQHEVRIFQRGKLVARHPLCTQRHTVVRDPEHYRGLGRDDTPSLRTKPPAISSDSLWPLPAIEVEVRDLGVYEAVAAAGGVR